MLKEKTQANHQSLEKKLVGKMRAMKDAEDYIKLLQMFYGYFGGLENIINPHISSKILPDYMERRKAALLSSDLVALNAKVPLIANGESLPGINNTVQALGALYVMEGSTLGGQIIKKMLSRQLGIEETFATSFFNGYGEETIPMWNLFKSALNTINSPDQQVVVVDSANETFNKFAEWIDLLYSTTKTAS